MATYCFGDIITTANSINKGLPDGNFVVNWIITSFDFNIFIIIKIIATIIACYSLIYCYKEGFHFTAIATSISIVIFSTIVVLNNNFATTPGIPKLELFMIFPIQIGIILIPLVLLTTETLYKQKQVKLSA
ncbi:MAG: hypothetical protein KAS01_00605 [Candidatus Pacebacteria bacterium]|nr:hypothetical protein [Candidatus Paceibacterota bacterium]